MTPDIAFDDGRHRFQLCEGQVAPTDVLTVHNRSREESVKVASNKPRFRRRKPARRADFTSAIARFSSNSLSPAQRSRACEQGAALILGWPITAPYDEFQSNAGSVARA